MRLRRCTKCWRYTLRDRCPECGSPTVSAHPARFSLTDKWGEYRRLLKKKLGLLPSSKSEGDVGGGTQRAEQKRSSPLEGSEK